MNNGKPSTPPAESAADYTTLDDGLLVRRFANCRDEAAFAELVRRYRLLVFGVAQRVLSHREDVEDVFQAAFLVLARDAANIRNRASAASWLYGVAHRLALKARAKRAAKRESPLKEETMDHANPFAEVAQRSELQALDEELHQLPERYREPLVLHYLLGRTNQQIAEELRMTVSAVEGRMKRGRDRLRKRLARRGVGLIAVAAALQSCIASAAASVPDSLAASAVQAGLSYTSAGASNPLYSNEAAGLAAKEMTAMSTTSMGALGVTALVTTLVVGLAIGISAPGNPLAADGETPVLDAAPESEAGEKPDAFSVRVFAEDRKKDDAVNPLAVAKGGGKGPQASLSYDQRSASREKIEAKLDETTQVDFIDTTLADAVSFIADLHNITIIIDEDALQDDNIKTDVQINRVLSNITLRSTLNIILEPLHLTYVIRNEVMMITTKTKAEEILESRLYEARHLKHIPPTMLIQVIQQSTSGPWFDVDGIGGTIAWVPGGLVVRQTQKVQNEVESLLQQLARQPELSAAEAKQYEAHWKEHQRLQAEQRKQQTQDSINSRLYQIESLLKKLEKQQPAGGGMGGGKGGMGGGKGEVPF